MVARNCPEVGLLVRIANRNVLFRFIGSDHDSNKRRVMQRFGVGYNSTASRHSPLHRTDLEGVSRVRSAGGRLCRTTEGETMHVLVRGLTPAPTMRGGAKGQGSPLMIIFIHHEVVEREKREKIITT